MALIQKCREFSINSRDRTSGTDSNFSFTLDVSPGDHFDRAYIYQLAIPKSYYVIQEGYNTFTVTEVVDRTITIPAANYGRKSFQTKVKTLLNTGAPVGWTYDITYPDINEGDTGKYTFIVSGNGGTQPVFNFTNSFVFENLGFNKNSINPFVANSLESVNVIKLQAEDSLQIHSNICQNGNSNILLTVYGSGNPNFSTITYQCTDVEGSAQPMTSESNNIYNFYLTNEDDEPMDLNGQNWNFTLRLFKRYTFVETVMSFIDVVKSFINWALEKF